MKIFNSLTQTFFTPPDSWSRRVIRMFVCGPTVYDLPHIGHARTYIAFDMIARWLRTSGYRLKYVQNITDIDDKLIDRAAKENISVKKLAAINTRAYHRTEKDLNITSVNAYKPATGAIKEIIKQITTLLKKGFAYETDDGIYFHVASFKNYGALSRQNIKALRTGTRAKIHENKKDPLDFALWKKTPDNKSTPTAPAWKSPWGWGRPGWHIEDTAITEKCFGPQYEIHGGADELKFPHHEAEIAQQESSSGKTPMVQLWMHTGVLFVNGQKMSKSLGNFITVDDFIATYDADTLRLMILSHLYRSPIDYTETAAHAAHAGWMTLHGFLRKLVFVTENSKAKGSPSDDITKTHEAFESAMDNDFHTPRALAALFELIKKTEPHVFELSSKQAGSLYNVIAGSLEVLGFDDTTPSYVPPSTVYNLARKRERARKNTQFVQADVLREKIERLGYKIDDTPIGPYLYKQ